MKESVAPLPKPGVLGVPFARGAQLYGNTFFATLVLFIGLSIQLLGFKKQAARAQIVANVRA